MYMYQDVPPSTRVYKWVLVVLMLGETLQWTTIPSQWEEKHSYSLHAMGTRIPVSLSPLGHWFVTRLVEI